MALSVLTSAIACGTWIFSKQLDWYWIGTLAIGALGVAGINAGCMFFAALSLREIMER